MKLNWIMKIIGFFSLVLLNSCITIPQNVNLELKNKNKVFGDIKSIKAKAMSLTYISCEELCQVTINHLISLSEEVGGDTIYNLQYKNKHCGKILFNICEISAMAANSWEIYNYFPGGNRGGKSYDQ